MNKNILALFVSRKKIAYKDIFKMLGVSENNMCNNLIEDIGDAIEDLVISGTLCLDGSNNLRRN